MLEGKKGKNKFQAMIAPDEKNRTTLSISPLVNTQNPQQLFAKISPKQWLVNIPLMESPKSPKEFMDDIDQARADGFKVNLPTHRLTFDLSKVEPGKEPVRISVYSYRDPSDAREVDVSHFEVSGEVGANDKTVWGITSADFSVKTPLTELGKEACVASR